MKRRKPLDPATTARLRREKRCYQSGHMKDIFKLTGELEDRARKISDLEAMISRLHEEMAGMVHKSEAEEAARTERLLGYRDGEEGKRLVLEKEQACFTKMHRFTDGKRIENLNFGEIITLFSKLANKDSFGPFSRITVLVPSDIAPGHMTEDELRTMMRKIIVSRVDDSKQIMMRNVPKKEGD